MAYSADLRWRAIFHFFTLLPPSTRKVASLLRMSQTTIVRIVRRYVRTGTVETSQGARLAPPANQVLTTVLKHRLLDMMLESADDDMFKEVQQRFSAETGVFPSISTFCRVVWELGFSRQRVRRATTRAARARRRGSAGASPRFRPPSWSANTDARASDTPIRLGALLHPAGARAEPRGFAERFQPRGFSSREVLCEEVQQRQNLSVTR